MGRSSGHFLFADQASLAHARWLSNSRGADGGPDLNVRGEGLLTTPGVISNTSVKSQRYRSKRKRWSSLSINTNSQVRSLSRAGGDRWYSTANMARGHKPTRSHLQTQQVRQGCPSFTSPCATTASLTRSGRCVGVQYLTSWWLATTAQRCAVERSWLRRTR